LRIIEINNNYVENSAKRLLFEHILLLKHHVAHHYDVHFRIDELVSPAFRLISAPTIAIFHATQHMLIPQHIGDSGLKLRYLNTMKSVAMHCATIPVTVSHHAKAELSGLYPFAHEKIHVVYHGVNHDVFRPSKLPYSHNKYQQKFGKYILSVSDRHVHKNYRRLIQAYVSLVKNDCIEEKLVLVGRAKVADEERKIRKLIDGSNLQEKVQLLDYMDQIDIAQLYQGAVAYVFPSLFETFGFTPLEAMACGVPVACSRYSVMPEICGESVQYFDPLDIEDMARGISFVVKDESRRKELIQRGLERASYYSWRRAAEEYYKILMKMDRS
jgi:glycosyltransferase involved in cell wall biosynthesis